MREFADDVFHVTAGIKERHQQLAAEALASQRRFLALVSHECDPRRTRAWLRANIPSASAQRPCEYINIHM